MVVFKLEQFPIVCRMCLKPATKKGMIPLETSDPIFEGSMQDFITMITFEFTKPKIPLLPRAICQDCYELLKFFAKFRTKLFNTHLFMNSLIELKSSNSAPMMDLFQSKPAQLAILFRDLDLCTKQEVVVDDLLNEFSEYHIGKMTEEEIMNEAQIDADDPSTSVDIFAEECTVEELAELTRTQEKKPKNQKKTYPCPHFGCSEVFKDARTRRKHYHIVHKPHVCETCGMRFSHASRMAVHKERHLNLMNHFCTYCDHRCNTKMDLRTHINVKHNAAYFFPCEICGVRFKRKSAMKDHVNAHLNDRKHKCDRCDKAFHKIPALKRHKRTVHENKRVTCEYCPETFLRTEMLGDHVEYVHGIQVRFICDICLQVFNDQASLDKHKLRHANPKELECGVCLDVFASSELMESHLCITYRENYICCDKDFWYHFNYNKHMLVAHGVRTNARVKPDPNHLWGYIRSTRRRIIKKCENCGIPFKNRKHKKEHMPQCTGPVQDNQTIQIAEIKYVE